MKGLAACIAGIVFGAGLAISQMTNPARVLGFLDVSGAWDPSLAVVMGTALATSALAVAWARRRSQTFLGEPLELPDSGDVDGRLLLGAVLFGSGWGLAGLCPGPAVAALVTGSPSVMLFVAAMVVGMFAHRGVELLAPRASDVPV